MRNIKRGDTWPPLTMTLTDGGGSAPIDLSTVANVRVIIQVEGEAGVILGPAAVTDAPNGKVTYTWQPGDTDTAGTYRTEVEIEWSSGVVQTVPSVGYDEISINEDLGGVAPV